MPTFDNYPESDLIKMLYLGDTGAGKTGSLPALAAAGYNVRILDLDRGVQIIKDYVQNSASMYLSPKPGLWDQAHAKTVSKRISYVTLAETITTIGGKPVAKGDSWALISRQLDDWKDGNTSLGSIETWTDKDILVIDSLSRLADASMYAQLAMSGRALKGPEQQDWWPAQNAIERTLVRLTSPAVKCHVIVVCHVSYIERDDKVTRGMPQTLGQALSPKIGQHFNHALLAKSSGQGTLAKREILTITTGTIDLKNTAPLRVKPSYELGTGLAEYFRDVLGHGGPDLPAEGIGATATAPKTSTPAQAGAVQTTLVPTT